MNKKIDGIWGSKKYAVELTLTTPILGVSPMQESVWQAHMIKKMTDAAKKSGMSEEEIKARIASDLADLKKRNEDGELVEDELNKGLTGFLKDETGYYIKDSQIKGFLKSAASVLKQWGAMKQLGAKVRANLYVTPLKIYLADSAKELEIFERPLRAQTPQGERTCLARSELIPEGTKISFTLESLLDVFPENLLIGLFEFGKRQGLGQYRSGSYGQFVLSKFEQI